MGFADFAMFKILLIVSAFWLSVLCKECTNIPTQLSSHTFRYELLSSNNDSWRKELFSYYHLIPTDDSMWSKLLPRRVLKDNILGGIDSEEEFSWAMLYRSIKNPGGPKMPNLGNFLREVPLSNVWLDPASLHGRAQQTNLEYLLMLDVDRLLWSFRKTANLSTPGSPYGGWEDKSCELRGHFVGHYLSASAHMWASTYNDSLHDKMSSMVSALHECQEAMGTGYLSAFPLEQFDRFEAIKPVWAPYYTIHKILAGLLDQYSFAGNTRAYQMAVRMADHFGNRVQNVIAKYSLERHWLSLNEETGGMNDVLYRLYTISGDQKHLMLAHLFDKPCFLGMLALQADSLSGFHANTHIPVVIGSQMRYEVTGDPLYKEIGRFFMDVVNSSHSFATGGTSVSEFWSDPKRLANTLQTENEESCTTYNMLKVSRHLFRWTREMAYADYYERALTNGVLSIQRGTEPGVMIYMLPMGRGVSKGRSYHGWGKQFDSFWCCYGTGIESFSKLGDSIYFEDEANVPSIYVIQFISSSLSWDSGRIMVHQKVEPIVSWDPYFRVSFEFSRKEVEGQESTLNLRIPFWTDANGANATLNAGNLSLPTPGSFLSVTRKWTLGDKLTLQLPINLRLESIKDDRPEFSSIMAILFGPLLLVGLSDGDWDIKAGNVSSISDWITAIPATYNSQLITLTQDSSNGTLVFTNTNNSITMEKLPDSGTDSAMHATFRLVSQDSEKGPIMSARDAIGKSVMLETFNMPEMVVVQQGPNNNLRVASVESDSGNKSSVFQVVTGLDRKANSVSLESESRKGCFVYGGVSYSAGKNIQLSCKPKAEDAVFQQAVSFTVTRGMSEYFPSSFKVKGLKRNFVLMPLLSLRDESYTVYFNFTV